MVPLSPSDIHVNGIILTYSIIQGGVVLGGHFKVEVIRDVVIGKCRHGILGSINDNP